MIAKPTTEDCYRLEALSSSTVSGTALDLDPADLVGQGGATGWERKHSVGLAPLDFYRSRLNAEGQRHKPGSPGLAGMSTSSSIASSATRSFAFDDSLEPWNITAKDWLLRNREHNAYDGVATGTIVFNSKGQVLLIQRASHDSLPNRWEFPGGAVDDDDPTILHAAARELWEEAGLVAKRFTHVISETPDQRPGEIFRNRTKTKTFIRFTFSVEVESCDEVKLDPNEHQDFAWASEEEVREQKICSREVPMTRSSVQALFMQAFRMEKNRMQTL